MIHLTGTSGGTEPARLCQGVSLWADGVLRSGPNRRRWALVHQTLDMPRHLTIFLYIQGIVYGVVYGNATTNLLRDSVSFRLSDPLSFRRIPSPFLWKTTVPWEGSQAQTLHAKLYLKYLRGISVVFPHSLCWGTALSMSTRCTL